jgi:hypothetical protein
MFFGGPGFGGPFFRPGFGAFGPAFIGGFEGGFLGGFLGSAFRPFPFFFW